MTKHPIKATQKRGRRGCFVSWFESIQSTMVRSYSDRSQECEAAGHFVFPARKQREMDFGVQAFLLLGVRSLKHSLESPTVRRSL